MIDATIYHNSSLFYPVSFNHIRLPNTNDKYIRTSNLYSVSLIHHTQY